MLPPMSNPPPFTLAYAQARLSDWLKALEVTATGASYSIGNRTLTRQDNVTIRAEIQRWHNTVLAVRAWSNGVQRPLGAQPAFPAPGSGGTLPDVVAR